MSDRKNTAWKLFGSTSVTGLQICVDHQTRTIRGVVQQPGNGVYLQGKDQKKKVFCRLTLASDKMEEAQNFLLQYGLTGHVLRMDYLRSWQTLSELVPGRWSDFSGWKENVQTRKQQLRQIAKMRKTGIEYYYETQCRRYKADRCGTFVCLAGSIFVGYQYTHRKSDGYRNRFICPVMQKSHQLPRAVSEDSCSLINNHYFYADRFFKSSGLVQIR